MKTITNIIILIVLFLSFTPALARPYSQPYPPPEPTLQPLGDIVPPVVLVPNEFCDTYPAEDNVCAWGLKYVEGGLTRWYVTKDGVMDSNPLYNFCVVWTNKYGNNFDDCLTLQLINYYPHGGIGGSGRNVYATHQWIICGSGFVNFDFWMTNIDDDVIYGEIMQPNIYYVICTFLPSVRRF